MSEQSDKHVATQIFQAVHYLHQKKIVHRDINLENILIESIEGEKLKVRLIDFGFSRLLPENQKFTKQLGSEHYLAPDVFNQGQYDEKIDVWAATVCIFVLLTGELPFCGEDEDEIYKQVSEKEFDF